MMARIVGIGANVCDTLITLKRYPAEDTKLKSEGVCRSGGGPVATGLVAAAKLGADCAYIGNLSDDADGAFLKDDFARFGVSTEYCETLSGYRSFTSCIWLSEERATRTVVFDRGTLPGTLLDERTKKAIADAAVLMVDGNDLDAAVEAAKIARENGTKVLYDAGGLYEGIERLLPYADYLIPSEEFALRYTGAKSAEDAAKILFENYSPAVVVVTQGKRGGILFDGKTVRAYPAFPVHAVDSNGAGDVFHGAFAFALTRGFDADRACLFASATSAIKCKKTGARDGAPDYAAVTAFLKENGYEL
ncbi:MAG: hypothetical protein IKP74_01180 [Clostridia bacterium]|nr:hypothetical protein [Clostridia bacterium]